MHLVPFCTCSGVFPFPLPPSSHGARAASGSHEGALASLVSQSVSHACPYRWFLVVCLSVWSSGGVAWLFGCGGFDGLSALAPTSRLFALSVFRFSSGFWFVSLRLAAPLHTSSLDPGCHLTQANVQRGFLPSPLEGRAPPRPE